MTTQNLVAFWGWTRTEQTYKKLVESAPKDWRVLAISYEDLLPKGDINAFQGAVLKFLEDNALKEVNLVGHSLGGALAIEFAYHHPEKVKRLYLLDSEGVYGHETIREVIRILMTHAAPGQKKMGKENIKAFYRALRKPFWYAKLAHFAHHAHLYEEASALRVPTVIIWGEKDDLTPLWQGQKLNEWIPGSRLVVLKDMDHDWIIHSPELFWENI
ncbi:MAG: alpha/beta hydrolase [bacterium]|nr:alpha/beta hydrolase [bacterium]